MPVPVPQQHPRLPAHRVIKPLPKGCAGHCTPQYVIERGATRPQPAHSNAEDLGSQSWSDSFYANSVRARHLIGDSLLLVADADDDTFGTQDSERLGSTAGQPRLPAARPYRLSPAHSSAASASMTWSLSTQAGSGGREGEANVYSRHPFPVKQSGPAEVYAERYETRTYSRLPPLKQQVAAPAPAPECFGFMEADPMLNGIATNMEGVTPFADYVDRISAADDSNELGSFDKENLAPVASSPIITTKVPSPGCLNDPVYIKTYQALAPSLSEWFSEYVWKVCTRGMSLPPRFVGVRTGRYFPERPPTNLADSIKGVLCATLLQPSAVALALWYISRLPVFIEQQVPAGTLTTKETEFRYELFGEGGLNGPINDFTDQVPFKVALLGCMFANKWLEDNTFSNKTWHSISFVPLQVINRLESLALSVLSHDLSVPAQAWDQWLVFLRSYQQSSSPFPSPIRRPSSTDSNSLIKKLIEDLMNLQAESAMESVNDLKSVPSPLFSELLVKEEGRSVLSDHVAMETCDIDLDEDGPLRSEYVPKRRSSQRSSYSDFSDRGSSRSDVSDSTHAVQHLLPPPANWVPHEDTPIFRQRRERYLPVAPMLPLGGHGASGLNSVQQQQPWWVDEQERITTVVGRDEMGVNGNMWYQSQPAATHSYASTIVAPPLSFTRSTLCQDMATSQARASTHSLMDHNAFNYSHCRQPMLAPSYSSVENNGPFTFRPQYLRA